MLVRDDAVRDMADPYSARVECGISGERRGVREDERTRSYKLAVEAPYVEPR